MTYTPKPLAGKDVPLIPADRVMITWVTKPAPRALAVSYPAPAGEPCCMATVGAARVGSGRRGHFILGINRELSEPARAVAFMSAFYFLIRKVELSPQEATSVLSVIEGYADINAATVLSLAAFPALLN